MIKIIGFKPQGNEEQGVKPEADLSIKILDNNENACFPIAQAIHKAHTQDCRATGRLRTVFRPNLTYEFSSGLVFRFQDDRTGEEARDPALEFHVPPESQKDKQAVLATIPALLRSAGVDDEDALAKLQDFIKAEKVAMLDTTKSGVRATR